jgi:hypothetical protein
MLNAMKGCLRSPLQLAFQLLLVALVPFRKSFFFFFFAVEGVVCDGFTLWAFCSIRAAEGLICCFIILLIYS